MTHVTLGLDIVGEPARRDLLTGRLVEITIQLVGPPEERRTVLMGVLFVLAPWVMSFTGFTALSWTAWGVGIVALLAGVAECWGRP